MPATRYAMPIEVPQLKAKLGALYLLSRVDSDSALGRQFRSESEPIGITGKSVRNWIYGEGNRERSHVPAHRFERLVEIVQRQLPGGRTFDEARALLMSPNARELYFALLDEAPTVEWLELVLAADTSGIAVIPGHRPGMFSVTTRHPVLRESVGQIEVPVNGMFRFKFDELGPGWLTTLQWGASGWYDVELSDVTIAQQMAEREVALPRDYPYLSENECGVRRYVFIITPTPLPASLSSTIRASGRARTLLDITTLRRLAHHLVSEAATYVIKTIDVRFVDPAKIG